MTSEPITAAAAGTWKLGDLTVNLMGFGAMRLTPDDMSRLDAVHLTAG
jgi:hypothetical protein